MVRLSGCQPSTRRARAGAAAPCGVCRATSVTVNRPGSASRRCWPLPRSTALCGAQSRTVTGRVPASSPSVPLTDVLKFCPSSVITGPRPQGRRNVAAGSRAATCSRDSAGIFSLARPSTGCPEVPGCAADDQPGKLRFIWSVTSGGKIVATPPSPIVASRFPKKLLTLIFGGAAAKPNGGWTTISEIRRKPCQLRLITGFGVPDIQGFVPLPKRLSGPNGGSDPQVEVALPVSDHFPG